MKTNLIKCDGNFYTLILDNMLIECGISHDAESEVINDEIHISADYKARKNWDKYFNSMSQENNDILFIEDSIDLDSVNLEW